MKSQSVNYISLAPTRTQKKEGMATTAWAFTYFPQISRKMYSRNPSSTMTQKVLLPQCSNISYGWLPVVQIIYLLCCSTLVYKGAKMTKCIT